jgi:hypothetical protein
MARTIASPRPYPGIAAALLGDPPVLILDEPFNGMDPEGIVWMRGYLRVLAAQGRAVLGSSHLMSDLEDAAAACGNDLSSVGEGLPAVAFGNALPNATTCELPCLGASTGSVRSAVHKRSSHRAGLSR